MQQKNFIYHLNSINIFIKLIWIIFLAFELYLYVFRTLSIELIGANWRTVVISTVFGHLIASFIISLFLWLIFKIICYIFGNKNYLPSLSNVFLSYTTIYVLYMVFTP